MVRNATVLVATRSIRTSISPSAPRICSPWSPTPRRAGRGRCRCSMPHDRHLPSHRAADARLRRPDVRWKAATASCRFRRPPLSLADVADAKDAETGPKEGRRAGAFAGEEMFGLRAAARPAFLSMDEALDRALLDRRRAGGDRRRLDNLGAAPRRSDVLHRIRELTSPASPAATTGIRSQCASAEAGVGAARAGTRQCGVASGDPIDRRHRRGVAENDAGSRCSQQHGSGREPPRPDLR
jgi:hypothetical protein